MKLTGWHIDGFGVFHNAAQELTSDLVIVCGHNEAGKTTLLDFLRGALFGFPSGNTNARRNPPLNGGTAGGRLFLDHHGERLTIDRGLTKNGLKVLRSDGTAAAPDDLDRILGSADQKLFERIFAFGLHELSDFATLKGEGAGNKIFSAGVLGAGKDARSALAVLDKQLAELFKPGGQKGQINQRTKELEQLDTSLAATRARAGNVTGQQDALAHLEHEASRLAREVTAAEAEARRLDNVIDLWPDWLDAQEAAEAAAKSESDLAGTPTAGPAVEFRADFLTQLDHAEQTVADAETNHVGRRAELRMAEEARNHIAVNDQLWVQRDALDQSVAGQPWEEARQNELASLRASMQATQAEIGAELEKLGPTWNLDRVAGFDGSIPAAEAIRSMATAIAATETSATDAHRRHDQLERETGDEISKRDGWRQRLESFGGETGAPTTEEIDAWAARARELRGGVHTATTETARMHTLEANARLAEQTMAATAAFADATARAAAEAAESNAARAAVGAVPTWVAPALFGLAALFLIGAVGAGTAGQPIAAVALAMGAIALVTVAFVVRSVERAGPGTVPPPAPSPPAPPPATGVVPPSTGPTTATDLHDLRQQIQAIHHANAAIAIELGLDLPRSADLPEPAVSSELTDSPTLTLLDVDNFIATLEAHRRRRAEIDDTLASLTEADAAVARKTEVQATANASLGVAVASLIAAQAAWAEWLAEQHLTAGTTPDGAVSLFEAVNRARAAVRTNAQREVRAKELTASSHAFLGALHEVRVAVGRPDQPGEQPWSPADAAGEVAVLAQLVTAEREARAALERAEERVRVAITECDLATTRLQHATQQHAELLAAVHASDATTARAWFEALTHRLELRARIDAGERAVRAKVGAGPEAERVRALLARADPAGWAESLADLGQRVASLQNERDQALKHAGAAKKEVDDLLSTDEVAQAQLEREQAAGDLDELVRQYTVLAVARGIIHETLQTYERERQPAVVAGAGLAFSRVTGGAYAGVRVVDERILVAERSGREFDAAHLSRGAAEQLYLCMRFGLVREFATHTPLPIVMDDVLVNFDPERTVAVAKEIGELSTAVQVLFFTCHPRTAELLASTRPDAQLVTLSRS